MSYEYLRRLGVSFRPIDSWPGELNPDRRHSLFSAALSDTVGLLGRELDHLYAERVVLQIAIQEKDLRIDGLPRAQARADHPGVIVAFDSKWGPLKYATDEFTSWQDNLRAVAKAMEALRLVDRYGVSKKGEQYRGWRQLPVGGSTDDPEINRTQAARILAERGGATNIDEIAARILEGGDAAKEYGRRAAAFSHPDKPSGSEAGFRLVQKARELVGA